MEKEAEQGWRLEIKMIYDLGRESRMNQSQQQHIFCSISSVDLSESSSFDFRLIKEK